MKKIVMFTVLGLLIGIPIQVFGYGLGDAESNVIELNDTKLKMKTVITPEIIEEENHQFDLKIELLNSASEELISNVGYHLKILNSDDKILFEEKVQTYDTKLFLKFKAKDQQEFDFSGEKNEKNFWISSSTSPLKITGPIFLEGGIYKIQTSIEILEEKEIQETNSLETILIIGEIIPFQVKDRGEAYEIRFITYFDKIENLSFNEDFGSFQAEMRFNWEENFIESVPFVHSEVYLPIFWKTFAEHEINTFVNGIQVFGLVDKSQQDDIIVHFLVNNKQLKALLPQIEESDQRKIIFQISAGEKIEPIPSTKHDTAEDALVEISSKNDWKVYLWWEPFESLNSKQNITFNIMFHDPETNLMQKNIEYDFTIYQNDEVILSKPNSETPSGHALEEVYFANDGEIRLTLDNINNVNTNVEFEFYIGDESKKISIPNWIKTNALWWAEGKIDDSTFSSGIEYMIKEKIIQVPYTEKQEVGTSVIPEWVRNNSLWWAEDQITDKDFASGLQFLIKTGIITV